MKKKYARPFNKLTPAEAERLALLAEELGECQQAVGKILRHGYESGWNGSNNRDDLVKEIGDIAYATALMVVAGDIKQEAIEEACSDKSTSVGQFLHHQEKKTIRSLWP